MRRRARLFAPSAFKVAVTAFVGVALVAGILIGRGWRPAPGLPGPSADDLRELPEVAVVEVAVAPKAPTSRIVHVRDWHFVPADLFEIIAEVILWAREVRDTVDAQRRGPHDGNGPVELPPRRIAAPGEDLTHYPL